MSVSERGGKGVVGVAGAIKDVVESCVDDSASEEGGCSEADG